MMRSGNPVLNDKTFSQTRDMSAQGTMTIQGTTNKAFVLLGLVLLSAAWVWENPAQLMVYVLPAGIVGFILALVTIFKKEWSMVTAPLYSLAQGVLLGGISMMFEKSYPGIVTQAVGLTFGTLFALLVVYKLGIVKVTDSFRVGVMAATGGIALFYFVTFILGFFHVNVGIMTSSSPMGIAFSLFVVFIAALNLVLDFDFIERGSRMGAPKYMEWYGAFGLMVTLIWLYMEILRLLAKTRRR